MCSEKYIQSKGKQRAYFKLKIPVINSHLDLSKGTVHTKTMKNNKTTTKPSVVNAHAFILFYSFPNVCVSPIVTRWIV